MSTTHSAGSSSQRDHCASAGRCSGLEQRSGARVVHDVGHHLPAVQQRRVAWQQVAAHTHRCGVHHDVCIGDVARHAVSLPTRVAGDRGRPAKQGHRRTLKDTGHGSGYLHREFAGVFRAGAWNQMAVGIRMNSFDVARGLMREAPEAFDLSRETEATLRLYGAARLRPG